MKEANTEPGCPEKGTQKPRLPIPKPTEGEKQTAVLPSPLPDSDSANALRARAPALRPPPRKGTDLLLA